jgi:rare lipoprotein A
MRTSAGTYFRVTLNRWIIVFAVLMVAAILMIVSCAPRVKRVRGKFLGYAVASWYGPKFHGKLTASGEQYDMNSMTCAHKRLPFGTRLKLVNAENGKSAVVVVNDRGPFVRGRSLDLSRAAAEQLAMIGPGTSKLKVYYVGRDMRYKKYLHGKSVQTVKTTKRRPGELYTIQVGAFNDQESAKYIREGLALNHENAYIMEKWIDGERFYRVRIGKFSTAESARRYAELLADEGYSTDILPFEKL